MNSVNSVQLIKTAYFYFQENSLKSVNRCSDLPEDDDLEFCRVCDAVAFVQELGCRGFSQHEIKSEYHRLVLAVLRYYIKNFGESFPVVYRGVRSVRLESSYKILFGTLDIEVARFYGKDIKVYRNIKGMRAPATTVKSVFTDDWEAIDSEIIFFADLLDATVSIR